MDTLPLTHSGVLHDASRCAHSDVRQVRRASSASFTLWKSNVRFIRAVFLQCSGIATNSRCAAPCAWALFNALSARPKLQLRSTEAGWRDAGQPTKVDGEMALAGKSDRVGDFG